LEVQGAEEVVSSIDGEFSTALELLRPPGRRSSGVEIFSSVMIAEFIYVTNGIEQQT
jgi:hypothetical protein